MNNKMEYFKLHTFHWHFQLDTWRSTVENINWDTPFFQTEFVVFTQFNNCGRNAYVTYCKIKFLGESCIMHMNDWWRICYMYFQHIRQQFTWRKQRKLLKPIWTVYPRIWTRYLLNAIRHINTLLSHLTSRDRLIITKSTGPYFCTNICQALIPLPFQFL